ncbi:gluconate 2-dehydrogenase subunit 3 family protein [Pontibacter silvestris]|uniref:Gluconate 2-dehydrogenase subunit 3 family protein n=1 Tax=Pontibacter silvestris TaxID=2305183 RepID=A0ABW4X205_9BACT|nr:gluconate 2-dehydrogenase subunit 3 family protein [Pontibacter silvestris]MCC9138943.1 gluconate 2-dehydrogenase subunit 3 family protein [Pontibacter silvestris]
MKRREAVYKIGALMGTSISAPLLFSLLNGCTTTSSDRVSVLYTEEQKELIAEIAELIIPATDTPGAKEAKVPEFIMLMLADCYTEADRKRFLNGLNELEQTAEKKYDRSFLECDQNQQLTLLTLEEASSNASLERQEKARAQAATQAEKEQEPELPFFAIIKELTIAGYFTSEIGATKALAYEAVPGHFRGSEPLKPGQKAWAVI